MLACLTALFVHETYAVKKTTAPPPARSTAAPTKEVSAEVGLQPKAHEHYAGGPVELDLTVANRTPRRIHYLAGTAHGRPAFMKFSAELRASGLKLCDPDPNASMQPDGMFARLTLDPEQVVKRTIVLNQFVTLEGTRDAIAEGQSAQLTVRWQYFLGSQTEDLPPATDPAEGELEVTLVRNDERMREIIQSLSSQLSKDSKDTNADPAERRDAAIALTSLRIPEVVPNLQALADFPDFEIRSMAQHALKEIANEPKRPTSCD